MDFLHRRRSLALASPELATDIDKPLPTLPGLTTTKMGAIENIPRNRTSSHSSAAGELIRRVSSMFSSRKKRPPALQLAKRSTPRIYESRNSSLQSLTESEDDIRRPSGLGSAVSIISNRSLPPSPFVPTYDYDSVFSPVVPNGYLRTRATSSPNLLRSFSLVSKGSKLKGRDRGGSVLSHHASQPQLKLPGATILFIPVETMVIIFSHLSKSNVALVASTCRLFSFASRTVLYGNVDLQLLSPRQLEKFIAVLASRRDLTDLVRTFTCQHWPSFFLAAPSSSPLSTTPKHQLQDHDADRQHRHTLLTATFTLAFQRMSNLTSLTLPAYDHDLLAHHTAFGLRSITFTCTDLSIEGSNELFAWLDGQTNITTLLFPNLVQDSNYGKDDASTLRPIIPTTPRPASSSGLPSPTKRYLVAPYLVPFPSTSSPKTSRPKSASPSSPSYHTTTFPTSPIPSPLPSPLSNSQTSFLIPSPSSSSTNIGTTNISHNYSCYQTSPLSSPTLLPNLAALHGPPSLVVALTADDPNSNRRSRPLKNVIVNINSTLYSGLRPAMIMNKLVGRTRHLGLRFGGTVDRRTVEKVLGAAGSALGGNIDAREQDGRFGSGFKFGDGEWKGLLELDVVFGTSSPGAPGSDEALHKMIGSAIPRYPLLRGLRLSYHHDPQIAGSPLTLSPASPAPSIGSPKWCTGNEARRLSGITDKDLSPPEQAYIRQWTKHCPDLGRVAFLSGSEWHRK